MAATRLQLVLRYFTVSYRPSTNSENTYSRRPYDTKIIAAELLVRYYRYTYNSACVGFLKHIWRREDLVLLAHIPETPNLANVSFKSSCLVSHSSRNC